MKTREMEDVLQAAYAHPSRGGFYYSGAGTPTGSARLNALERWDWTPTPRHEVEGGSTILFPLALGCPPRKLEDGREWIEKCIHKPSDTRSMSLPDVNEGQTGTVLRNLKQVVAMLPEGHRVSICDIQSPLGVAELMWDESFYIALVEEPSAVNALLEKITEFLIAFVKEYQRIAGSRLNPCGWPRLWADGPGTMLSDDTMTLVSPSMHAEFSLPYVNRIADACGPLYYHSCTWRKPYFENIHQVRNVRAYNWNPANSDPPAVIMREFGRQALLVPHLSAGMHRDPDVIAWGCDFADEAAFFRHLLDGVPDNTACYLYFSDVIAKPEVIEPIYDLLEERGLTPNSL